MGTDAATSDEMKARAETANVPRLVQGSDGAGWVADIQKDPMRTLPGGAGYLVVQHLLQNYLRAGIQEIQFVNMQRANRWHGGDFRNWSGLEWAGAMCGEAGEAANVAKKLRRVELTLDGNAKSERPLVPAELVEKLAGECADVFLYLCLLASRYDIDLSSAVTAKFNQKSIEMGFPERIIEPRG
jgi:NTP pyrophosphatase (non-canonical NTP hydrolase)